MERPPIKALVSSLGVTETSDASAVLMTLDAEKGVRFWTVDEVGDGYADDPGIDALYIASGLFKRGTVARRHGKTQENLSRVLWLPWDADLLDFMGADAKGDDRQRMARELQAMEQTELDALIDQLREAVEIAANAVRIPIHRMTYTGYGICFYTHIRYEDQERIQDARAVHKIGIDLMNQFHGSRLIDPQTSDAGTRVTRLEGSYNRKNPDIPRRVRSLVSWTGQTIELPTLDRATRTTVPPKPREIPKDGDGLSAENAVWIINAIRPFWTLGQKHALALALAGSLAKAAIPEHQAELIIERLASDDDIPQDRMKALARTYERVRSGADVQGYTALQGMIDPVVLNGLDRILDAYRASKEASAYVPSYEPVVVSPGVTTSNGHHPDEETSYALDESVPDACLTGWIREYVDLMLPLSEAPISYHVACALTLAGATFGRSVASRYVSKRIYPNLYTMLVGNAGTSRKDTAIRLALELPFQIPAGLKSGQHDVRINKPPFRVTTDVGSAEGLVKFLADNGNTLFYATEYKRLSQNAHRQSTSTILSMLTAAWDTPVSLDVTTKNNPLSAQFPFLSILAAVQPSVLSQEMTREDIESGYATRWLFVPGSGSEPIPNPPNIDEQQAYDLYTRLLRRKDKYEQIQSASIDLDEGAGKRWTSWYEEDRRRNLVYDDEDSMRSRLGVHIRKLALIYAALDGADAISIRHLDPAIAFVEWDWKNVQVLMKGWGIGLYQRIENAIERAFRKYGPMRRRDVWHRTKNRDWSAYEFGRVFESMVKNETVVLFPDGTYGMFSHAKSQGVLA